MFKLDNMAFPMTFAMRDTRAIGLSFLFLYLGIGGFISQTIGLDVYINISGKIGCNNII